MKLIIIRDDNTNIGQPKRECFAVKRLIYGYCAFNCYLLFMNVKRSDNDIF